MLLARQPSLIRGIHIIKCVPKNHNQYYEPIAKVDSSTTHQFCSIICSVHLQYYVHCWSPHTPGDKDEKVHRNTLNPIETYLTITVIQGPMAFLI